MVINNDEGPNDVQGAKASTTCSDDQAREPINDEGKINAFSTNVQLA